MVKWHTRSQFESHLPPELVSFLAEYFNVEYSDGLVGYTQLKLANTIFHCHPNYRGQGPWYDWAMIKYIPNEDNPDVTNEWPARILAFVQELSGDGRLSMVIQWAGGRIRSTCHLFHRYVFHHDPDNPNYEVYPVETINKLILAIPVEDETEIVIPRDYAEWPDRFCSSHRMVDITCTAVIRYIYNDCR